MNLLREAGDDNQDDHGMMRSGVRRDVVKTEAPMCLLQPPTGSAPRHLPARELPRLGRRDDRLSPRGGGGRACPHNTGQG
jgi:hypothetical protein